jgi:hypothetical protein
MDFRDFYHNRVDQSDYTNFPLRDNVEMERDFVYLPKGAWKLLHLSYGGSTII